MIAIRRIPAFVMLAFSLPRILASAGWAVAVYAAYAVWDLEFLRVPFLPISTVGTAVAFYTSFKNNSAYDRFWEARKIWGGIVNASRTWALNVLTFVRDEDGNHRELVHRQLAWINALRIQLRARSRFVESGRWFVRRRLARHETVLRQDWTLEVQPFIEDAEFARVRRQANPATHLLARQGEALRGLLESRQVDLFHQIELMSTLKDLYTLQGRCERIKNTPLPRQYAEVSRWFTTVFTFSVPFGLLDVFAVTGLDTPILTIVIMALCSGIIAWVFVTMEQVGDGGEDPFERSMGDVPMNALCRGIEIDLRQLLGEEETPEPETPVGAILY